jgi:hypothetical protein
MMVKFRTYCHGFDPMVLAAFAVHGLPVVVLLGFRPRVAELSRRVAVISLLALCVAQAWSGTEEFLWRRGAPQLETAPEHYPLHALLQGGSPFDPGLNTVSTQRWWPFEHHTLRYNPESGQRVSSAATTEAHPIVRCSSRVAHPESARSKTCSG